MLLFLWDTDVMSTPHNHRDWLMHLLTVKMFEKIDRDLKNKKLAFLQCDIHILCENTHAQSRASGV